ncbi:MAG: geranylgeranylglyceryl/heptaprenylglyceryl phosphate synthase [Candidatus Aenigmatarchaeota archaeon]
MKLFRIGKKARVYDKILKNVEKRPLHFVLIDPDPSKNDAETLKQKARMLNDIRPDAIMIGGSSGFGQDTLDAAVKTFKDNCKAPVILFPGNISGVSKYADAIFFMSLLNSNNPYWITGAQAMASAVVRENGVEPIGMGYIIIEPGGTVSFVGDAKLIPRDKPEMAAAYALAAQYLGMKIVYLEAGSGANDPVPVETVAVTKKLIDVPLIVGGGMRTPESVLERLQAGADIIVTGTASEDDPALEKIRAINQTIKKFKRAPFCLKK